MSRILEQFFTTPVFISDAEPFILAKTNVSRDEVYLSSNIVDRGSVIFLTNGAFFWSTEFGCGFLRDNVFIFPLPTNVGMPISQELFRSQSNTTLVLLPTCAITFQDGEEFHYTKNHLVKLSPDSNVRIPPGSLLNIGGFQIKNESEDFFIFI